MDKEQRIGQFHSNMWILDKLVNLLGKFDDMTTIEEVDDSIKRSSMNEISRTLKNSFYSEEDKLKAKKLLKGVRQWRTALNSTYLDIANEKEIHPDHDEHPDNLEAMNRASYNAYIDQLEVYHKYKYGDLLPFIFESAFVLDKSRLGKNENIYCWSEQGKVTYKYNHDDYYKKNVHLFKDVEPGKYIHTVEVWGGAMGTKGGIKCDEVPYNFTGTLNVIRYEQIWDALLNSTKGNKALVREIENNPERYKDAVLEKHGIPDKDDYIKTPDDLIEPNLKYVSSFIIKEAWLGYDYICEYKVAKHSHVDKTSGLAYSPHKSYYHDLFFYKNMKKIIAKKTWQDPNKRQIEFKDVPQYIIRQAWLGEGYLCSYKDRDGNLQVYDHDAFYERNKDKIDNNKSWNNPNRQEVTDGQKKKLPYGEESEFHDLEEI
jgi:hypothetical protein